MILVRYLIVLVLSLSFIQADELALDTFDSSMDGWSLTKQKKGKLLIDRDRKSRKVYTFAYKYHDADVIIEFDMETIGNWEGAHSFYSADKFKFYINGDKVISDEYEGKGTKHHYKLLAKVRSDANLVLEAKPDTTNDNEKVYIDNVHIYTIDLVENADDICYVGEPETTCGSFGGFNCTKTITLRSQNDIQNLFAGIDTSGFTGSFMDDCGVDGESGKNKGSDEEGSCQEDAPLSFGPANMFGNNVSYNVDSNMNANETHTIYTHSTVQVDFFSTEKLYAIYEKDGKFYRGKIKQCGASNYPCAKPHDFELRKKVILPGELVAIGNSSICADNDPKDGICDDNQKRRNDTNEIIFINAHSSSEVATQPTTLENVTGAELKLPKDAKVVWAGLYWQGSIWDINTANDKVEKKRGIETGSDGQRRRKAADKVMFKTPKSGQYKELKADEHYFVFAKRKSWMKSTDYYNIDRYEEHYQGFKDVTKEVQDGGSGTYWVGNIQATTGNLYYSGVEAAWSLQVIYEVPGNPAKSIAINDGYAMLYGNSKYADRYASENGCPTGMKNTGIHTTELDFDITGFLTPKTKGFDTTFTVFITDPDPDTHPDHKENLTVTKKDGTVVTVDGDNAWNYEIQNNGVDNLDRSPAYIYPLGMLIKNYTKKDILDTEQTKTHVKFQTGKDHLVLGVIGFSTELRKPKLCYDYAYSQGGQYFTEDYNASSGPKIQGHINTSLPIDLKFYIRNKEADILAEDFNIDLVDLNTTQAIYKDETTYVTYPKKISKTHIEDKDLTISDDKSAVKDLYIGDVDNLDYFYSYYSLEAKTTKVDMPIHARVRYTITLKAGDEDITIPYNIYLDDGVPICSATKDYNPAKGIFNLVNANYADSSLSTGYYNNLPTQVTKRVGDYKVLSLDPDDLDTKKAVSTVVAVDMIDAAAFHDTNASCRELSSAISDRIWVVFNNTDEVNFNAVADFFKTARRNAAFRVSYNVTDDAGTLYDVTYNGTYGISNLTEDAKNCGCSTTGMSKDQLDSCMECLYGKNTRIICSRDNFAIRPEAFDITLKDSSSTDEIEIPKGTTQQNIAAGYEYQTKITATNYIDSLPAIGYYKSFSTEQDTLAYGFEWSPLASVTDCNDVTNKAQSIAFVDGEAEGTVKVSQVGEYKLILRDTTWTAVDSDPLYMAHHTGTYFKSGLDCTQDSSDVVAEGNLGLNGCNISSNHTNNRIGTTYYDYSLKLVPYQFPLDNFSSYVTSQNLSITTQNFVYMTDISNIADIENSYHYNGDMIPKGADGSALSNFTDGCYATDLKFTMQRSDFKDDTTLKQSVSVVDADGNYLLTPNVEEITNTTKSITLPKSGFVTSMQGKASTRIYLNINKDVQTALNPQQVTFTKLSVACATPTECKMYANQQNDFEAIGEKTVDDTVNFYYGRSYAPTTTVNGSTGDGLIYYEAYCYATDSIGNDCDPSLLQADSYALDDPRWFVNKNHTNANGNAGVITQKRTPSKVTATQPDGNIDDANKGGDKTTLTYDESSGYPYKATMLMQSDKWLIFNKYDNTATTNNFVVEFNNDTSGWIGTGETDSATETKKGAKDRKLTW